MLTLFLLKINTILTIINRVLTLGYSVDSGQIGKVTHLYVQLIKESFLSDIKISHIDMREIYSVISKLGYLVNEKTGCIEIDTPG